jgi:hypothetical protein
VTSRPTASGTSSVSPAWPARAPPDPRHGVGKRAADVEGLLKAAGQHLWGLREALQSDNPEEVRTAPHELLEKLELSFSQQLVKGRKRSRFKEGVAHLKVDLPSFHLVTSAP